MDNATITAINETENRLNHSIDMSEKRLSDRLDTMTGTINVHVKEHTKLYWKTIGVLACAVISLMGIVFKMVVG
jgi:hypothetical protein